MIAKALRAKDRAEVPFVLKGLVTAVHASGNDLESLAAVICRPPSPVRRESLCSISALVLLIAGQEDNFIGNPEELHSAIQSATLEVLDGVIT